MNRTVTEEIQQFESMRNAIAMLQLMVQSEDDIHTGRLSGHEEVFARIAANLSGKVER